MTDTPARRICGAKTRSGKPCQSLPVRGRDRCRMHGGTAKRGIMSHSYKHGRYSQHLPDRLRQQFEAALSDPDLLALNSEIALIDTRVQELSSRLDTGETGGLWLRLQAAYREYKAAITSGVADLAAVAIVQVGAAIEDGAREQEAWLEIVMLLEQRRKLSESEQKRRVAMSNLMTAEQAMLLLGTAEAILRKFVTDPDVLDAVGREFEMLTSGDGGKRMAWE